jgi:hypothetical protein
VAGARVLLLCSSELSGGECIPSSEMFKLAGSLLLSKLPRLAHAHQQGRCLSTAAEGVDAFMLCGKMDRSTWRGKVNEIISVSLESQGCPRQAASCSDRDKHI